jgi:two-component system LytT family response regulator
MKPIRCLIVDDERLARQVMRDLLATHPDFQIVAEATDLTEAIGSVRRHQPDMLFLDVQMPGGDGFQLLDTLTPDLPHVVFVTAYDRHALRAFDVNALDFLLKPVEPERLALAIQRLRQRMSIAVAVDPVPVALPRLLDEDRVLLPLGNSGCFAPVRDILHIRAQGKYSAVQLCDGRELVVRQTLASWIARLPAGLFFPLDRSCVVQWRRIHRAEFNVKGGIVSFDAAGCEISLGHTAAQRLRHLLAEVPR